MTNEQQAVLQELRRISRLLTVVATKEVGTKRDRISILADAGFEPKEIADLVGTTPNTVSVTLHSLRKQQSERTSRGRRSNP